MEKFDRNLEELEVWSKGYWGTIYVLSDDLLLKTSTTSAEMTIDEFNRSRAVFEAGVPCVEPVKLVDTPEGPGVIMERIQGRSIARRAMNHLEDLDTYLDAYCKLGKKMWSMNIPESTPLPNIKEDLLAIVPSIRQFCDKKTVEGYVNFVNGLPDANRFCHMDFHWCNVMYNGGDSKIIDMPNAAIGHPAFDMMSTAASYNFYQDYPLEKPYQDIFRVTREEGVYIWNGFCQRMFGDLPEDVIADRRKALELGATFVYEKNFMRDYMLGLASDNTVALLKKYMEKLVHEDSAFITRVLNDWTL